MSTTVNCKNFASFLVEDDRDMDISDLEARSVHTSDCAECRDFLRGYQAFKVHVAPGRNAREKIERRKRVDVQVDEDDLLDEEDEEDEEGNEELQESEEEDFNMFESLRDERLFDGCSPLDPD